MKTNNTSFSSLLGEIKDFSAETQKSIIKTHQQQKTDELELGLIGKIFGKNPHVHYAGILLLIVILFIFFLEIKEIKAQDNVMTFLTHLASIIAGYMFGLKGKD